MIFGERFYPTLQKMPPWRHSLFALALATRAYPNFALWCDIKEQQGKREYLHALKQCWRFHYDKYNHVDLEAAYDIIEPLMPMELEEYSEGDSFAFDASVILDVALESVPFNSKNAKNASMASMASVIRLCENTNPEESDDEEKLLELDPIQAEIDFQVAVMEMVMEPRSAEVVKKLLELSLESKCSNIGIESDLTMDDFAESLVQTELSEEELAKRKGAVDPWGANKQANYENDGEDELAIEEGSDLDGDNEVANNKEELNTSDEQVANELLSDEKNAKQKIADDEITADEDYSNIDPSEFDEDLVLLEEEGESDEAFGDIVLVEDEDGVLTDMTAPFEGDADEEDDNKSNKRHAHRQERRKDHRDSPRREDRRFDRHPRRDREDGEGHRRDRKFGSRPRGDRPHGDRDRKFGDRPHGDRPFGDRDRKFGDRPRSDRPFGDRDRKFGDRQRGDSPFGDRDRKFGDRPRGDRPFGDRDRKFGDRPRGDRPFGDRDRKFGDRPHGDRKFGDRPFGDRKGRGGKFGDRSRHGEAPQKPRVFGPKSN
ncbi:DUF416 family protein [Anaerobiospirillum succiniciproducens]|uniref:DUF416 family protein n=1 Tax=Anaerobiospirillum succiniciproducens TaxID=13335 RepID=UPI00040B5831|nr:DUF416 family protein [Anaerobiospirillum succiniciproducens]